MRCGIGVVVAMLGAAAASAAGDDRTAKERDLLAGPKPKPIAAPSPGAIDTAIDSGVEFLIRSQGKEGWWGSPRRTKGLNIYAPVPGAHHAFRTATTALCLCALIETDGGSPEVEKAVERGEQWLFEHLPRLRRATPVAIYNVWGHAYSIQALVRMHGRRPEDAKRKAKIEQLIKEQMAFLRRYESVDGGWGYYDFRAGTQRPASSSISFVNGTVLVAFSEAEGLGIDAPEDVVRRAVAATLRQRKGDFSYLYGEYLEWQPMRGINRPGGSLGRSQVCNLALRLWEDDQVTDRVIKVWLDRLFARNGWLSIGRKRPVPHEAWFQVAAYFYYYGHYYAALCIEQLPAAERPYFQDHLAHLLLPLQEKDGSWWDFPFYDYHQPYGTAFAVMALHRCRRGG